MPSKKKNIPAPPPPPAEPPPVQYVRGIGPARGEKLRAAGFSTPQSLLYHLPFRYEDRRAVVGIGQLAPGNTLAIYGTVADVRLIRTRKRGLNILEAQISFAHGIVGAVFYNMPYLHKYLLIGRGLYLYGRLERDEKPGRPSLKFTNPEFELAEAGDEATLHAGRIVPVYKRMADVSPRRWREIIHHQLEVTTPADPLGPRAEKLGMPALGPALKTLHAPPDPAPGEDFRALLEPARRRLAFDELFYLQAGLLKRRAIFTEQSGLVLPDPPKDDFPFLNYLPYTLTGAQQRALREINHDLAAGRAMHRLLQGDVGSGKTAVALLTALRFAAAGEQAAIMAPTELLAAQHYRNFQQLIGRDFRVGLLTGSQPAAERKAARRAAESGYFQIMLGTHAMFQEKTKFAKLAFAVIDEQHRFGVEQRLLLKEKGKQGLHMLVMSATPIPRSITLTLFGDLDLTILDEKPPGRGKIVTAVRQPTARGKIDAFLESEMKAGRQIYVVHPVIEESELGLKTVVEGFADLQARFPGRRIGLLHGKLKEPEKNSVMTRFAAGEIDILAATTVIEVGIDVANATVMVVEHAERFGLSQLHQLRGRVGRGAAKSWCILLPGYEITEEGRERLSVMEKSDDGFAIAEADLRLRGPGELLGTKQSGVPEIRIADLVRDLPILEKARKDAQLFNAGELPLTPIALRQINERLKDLWGDRLEFAHSG
jgi:ATP-dependent DNA helicase RecG